MTKPRLLLADDSVTIRKVIELTFADEGIDVTAVADSDAAMSKFLEIQPDIVLVDVGLPGTDGYRICEMIKGDESTAQIPVLLLVGSFEPFDQDAAERSGADGFLTKPFHSIRDVVNRVKELLGDQEKVAATSEAIPFATTSGTSDTEDIEDLYEQSFAETVQMDDLSPLGFEANTGDAEPNSEEQASTDAVALDESHHSVDQWLDDEMIEVDRSEPPTDEQQSDEAPAPSPQEEAVEAISSYEEAPAAAVDIEPIKEFDWSPAAIVTASDEREISAAAGFSPAFIPEEPFVDWSNARDGNTTEEYPNLDTNELPDLSHETDRAAAADQHSGEEIPPSSDPVPEAAQPPTPSVNREHEDLLVRETANELVEIIINRVMDRLSDKAIREVAQEAVPRIAEKLMREALEEERKKDR